LHYHDIRGSKLVVDAVVFGLFGVLYPRSHEVALRRAEETKLEKYSDGVRSRLDIRFVPFAVAEFGALDGYAAVFISSMPCR
jgi:hypothetical protein